MLLGHFAVGVNAFTELDLGPIAQNVHDAAADRVADLPFHDVFIDAGRLELLDPEPQTAPFAIDFEDLSFHPLADFQRLIRMVQALFTADIADVDHALDAVA